MEVKDFGTIAKVVAAIAVKVVAIDNIAKVEVVADIMVVMVVIMDHLQRTRLKSLNSLVQADYPIAIDIAIATHFTRQLVVLVVVSPNLAKGSYLREMLR